MADTPDIAKIVSLIMENPSLVAEIADMAKGAARNDGEGEEVKEVADESVQPVSAPTISRDEPKRVHRMRLAAAMKPYLSAERAQAIDAMMSIVDILEVVRGKG